MGRVLIYADKQDVAHAEVLKKHLAPSVQSGAITEVRLSTEIPAGDDRLDTWRAWVEEAHIIAFLLTSDSLSGNEGPMLREEALGSKAQVVPVLLRACSWSVTALGNRQPLPRDLQPIATRADAEAGWVEVVREICEVVQLVARPVSHDVTKFEEALHAAYDRRDALSRHPGSEKALIVVLNEVLALRKNMRDRGQLAPGEALSKGRYVLREEIGRGGFATVWRAHDSKATRDVAIKVLHGRLGPKDPRRDGFFRGARVMAKLRHPAIVEVIEPEKHEDGFDYFVMELVPGGNLRDAVLQKRLSETQILTPILQVAAALEAAHKQGHVHRDVKPANLLLDAKGRAKLTDFDLVSGEQTTGGTRTGAFGTLLYAAPETLEPPNKATEAADVYGLGMTAVFCLLGRDLEASKVLRGLDKLIRSLPCGPAIQEVLLRATEWEPKDRYANVEAFRKALTLPDPPSPLRGEGGSRATPSSAPRVPSGERGPGGEALEVRGVRFRMCWIPPGKFLMGSPPTEQGRRHNEGPQHEVTITRGFWLAETPCTQALWEAVMGKNPSHFKHPNRPVERVSWDDCQAFLAKLNALLRGPPFRLPTEAGWEYACRAGTTQATWAGDLDIQGERNAPILDAIAWYGGNSGNGFDLQEGYDSSGWKEKQHPHTKAGSRIVGLKKPNPWGLHDMLGNVLEWCADGMRAYSASTTTDPVGASEVGSVRVCRGGSWSYDARLVRAAYRFAHTPGHRFVYLGFRLARGQP